MAKAHLLRAFALDLKGQRASAVAEYQAILKLTDIENSHKKARLFLGTPYRGTQRR